MLTVLGITKAKFPLFECILDLDLVIYKKFAAVWKVNLQLCEGTLQRIGNCSAMNMKHPGKAASFVQMMQDQKSHSRKSLNNHLNDN